MNRIAPIAILAVLATGGAPHALPADDVLAGLRPAAGPLALATCPDQPGLDSAIGAATDAQGGFAVAWVRSTNGPAPGTVGVRVFDARARPLGPVLRLQAGTGAPQFSAVARNARGSFVVTWVTFASAGNTFHAQRFAIDGAPLGQPLTLAEGEPIEGTTVGIDAAGDFAVAWDEGPRGVFLRRFVDGALLPTVQQLGAPGAVFPALAMQPNGWFVLAWHITADGASPLVGQLFDGEGEPVGETFQVGASSLYPIVATATAGGGFAFAWDQGTCVTATQPCQIQARFFGRGARALGLEVTVATPGVSALLPAIAADPQGHVAISWQECGAQAPPSCPTSTSVFTARGTPLLAPRSIPSDYQSVGPALIATPYGFLSVADRYSGPQPWGIYGWPLTLPAP